MAIIQSYPINYNIKDSDLLLGITNIATSGNPIYQTKSFRLSDIIGMAGSISIGTANGLSLNGTVLSLGLSSASAAGALSAADWTAFNAKPNASDVVTLAGAQTITGTKTFNNTSSGNGIVSSNTSSGNGIYSYNSSTGKGIYSDNISTGDGIRSDNNSTGTGIFSLNVSSGKNLVLANGAFATGMPFTISKNGVDKFTINDAGEATGNKFTKTGGTSSQFLKADGSVDSSTYLTSLSGAVLTTGDQTITGTKTFTSSRNYFQNADAVQIQFSNTTTPSDFLKIGYASSGNIYSSTGLDFRVGGLTSSALLIASNENATFRASVTANSFINVNASTGIGFNSTNSSTGKGIQSVNSSTGIGIRSDNTGSGTGIYSQNSLSGYGIYSNNISSGWGIYSSNSGLGWGFFSSNSGSGYGITSTNSAGGRGIYSYNTGNGKGIDSNNTSTGIGIYSTNALTGTGFYSVNSGAGVGIDSNNSSTGTGIASSNTGTGKGIYASNGSSGEGIYSYNSGLGTGIYSNNYSTGTGIYSDNGSTGYGIRSSNNSTGTGIYSSNGSTGKGIESFNGGAGSGIVSTNASTGSGIFAGNSTSGNGIYSGNLGTGNALNISNSATGTGIYSINYSSGKNLVLNNTTVATGMPFTIQKNGADKLTINDNGEVTGNKFTKTGGTVDQYLMADGSASAPSYAQMFFNAVGTVPIVFPQDNVWQPLGLVSTLSSPSRGFSLGLTDKCAFKNISGSKKTVTITINFAYGVSAFGPGPIVAVALNGNIINDSIADLFNDSYNISWSLEIENGDEISTYIKSFGQISYNQVRFYKVNIIQI